MIKKIHYIWLGGNKKSKRVKKCIQSWKNFFPGWEIIEWNEKNLNIDIHPYCRQAYDCKKYAFASDYLRLLILYEYGGLYFDTDVQVIQPMDDLIKKHDIIMGFESEKFIAPGLISYAGEIHLEFYKALLNTYKDDVFLNSEGECNTFTICERITPILEEIGFNLNDSFQIIGNIALFPHDYFCPTDYVWSRQDFTHNTRAIHHYDASWKGRDDRIKQNIKKTIYRILKPSMVKKILRLMRGI